MPIIHREVVAPVYNPKSVTTKSSSYTATADDDYIKVSATATITLPQISSLFGGINKTKKYKIQNIGSSATVTVQCSGSDVIGKGSDTKRVILGQNDYMIIRSTLEKDGVGRWEVDYESPAVDIDMSTETVNFKGDFNLGYFAVATNTSGTTAQNVFGSAGAPVALTITSVMAIAKDTNAANIIVKNGGNTVASFAKSTTARAVTGEDGALANTSVAKGAAVTVESSATNGDGVVIITFTV